MQMTLIFTLQPQKTELPAKVTQLDNCLRPAYTPWLQNNGLQLNPMKSEVIQFSTIRGRNRVDDVITLCVSESSIQPSSIVKSLGVTLDQKMSIDMQACHNCVYTVFLPYKSFAPLILCLKISLGLSLAASSYQDLITATRCLSVCRSQTSRNYSAYNDTKHV